MQKKYIPFLLCILLAAACKTGQKKEDLKYYPIQAFFKSQIHFVDSLQLPVTKYTTFENKQDSGLISLAEFRRLAAEFVTPDVSDSSLLNNYTETSFADQTIASVTLTYGTANTALPLQRLDVIINPQPGLNEQVKTVYMERSDRVHDTLVIKKLYWKANRNFQIITISQSGGQATQTSVIKVEWNNNG